MLAVIGVSVIWVAMNPEKAERVAGWIATAISKVYRRADRAAVAWSVAGEINDAREELLKSVPEGLIERKAKVKWTDSAEAEALLHNGEVLVCMEKADHHDRNVANALMAYLPKTMLPLARRYLDPDRMRAADLIVAKGLLDRDGSKVGALSMFFHDHLDPARQEDTDLRAKIDELDAIDLQGWLVRVLLAEYLRLGEALHPGEPDTEVRREAEEFARWMHKLCEREPGEEDCSMNFKGKYFRVAVIFVGIKDRLIDEGLKPYRKRAKRGIYRDEFDSIYLMGRDDNMEAVEALAANLESDGRVAQVTNYSFPLRADFKTRYGLNRDRSIISCVSRRRVAETAPAAVERELSAVDPDDLPEQTWEPTPPPVGQPLFDQENQPVKPEGDAEAA